MAGQFFHNGGKISYNILGDPRNPEGILRSWVSTNPT
jgi:hypothetical protein